MTPTANRFRSLLMLTAVIAAGALAAGPALADRDPERLVLEGGNAELSAEQYLSLHAKQDAEFLKTATLGTGYRRARVRVDES